MRYRLLASYQGAPYEAGVGPADSDVVLFAACPPPEDLRFEPATGHWRKQVHLADVQTLHESRPVGMFRGEHCVVLDDLNDRLHIVYLGHDAYRAEQIGYWEVDRGVFELITPRQEVTDIVEQRLAFPHRGDGAWQATAGALSDPATGYLAGTGNGAGAWPPTVSHPGQGQDSFSAEPQSAYDSPEARHTAARAPYAAAPGPDAAQQADSPSHGTLMPEPPGYGTDAYRTVAPGPQAPGYGTGAQGTVTRGPGAAGYEPETRGVAPSYPPEAPIAGFPGGDQGQALPGRGSGGMPDSGFGGAPGSGFGSTPDSGPADGDLASAGDPGSGYEPATAVRGSAPGYLTTTDASGVAMPMIDDPPLPLEAQARRAATAAHRRGQPGHAAKQIPQPAPQDALTAPTHPFHDAPPPADQPAQSPAQPQMAQLAQRNPAQPPTMAQPPQIPQPQATAQPDRNALAASAARIPSAATAIAAPQDTSQATTQQAQDRPPVTPAPRQPQAPAVAQPDQDAPIAVITRPQDAAQAAARPAKDSTAQAAAQQSQPAPGAGFQDIPAPVAVPFQDSPTLEGPGHSAHSHSAHSHSAHSHRAPTSEAPASAAPSLPNAPPAIPEQAVLQVAQQVAADETESQQAAVPRRRRAAKRRMPTQRIFSDLAAQAAIPATAYAVGEDVDGAMCLMRTAEGFEVFNSAAGARHEVRVFADEESAYFYLFGVLVADAVRTGALAPRQ